MGSNENRKVSTVFQKLPCHIQQTTYVVRIFFGKVGTLKRSTKVKQSPVVYVRAWSVSSEKKVNYHELNKYQDIFEVPLFWS